MPIRAIALIACLLTVSAGCGGGSGPSAPNDQLEKLLARTGMSICADGGTATSGCTEYTAAGVECGDKTSEFERRQFSRCEVRWESSPTKTHDEVVCAALAPGSDQGYAVKPLDACG